MKPPILSERDIEERARDVLYEFVECTGKALEAPVPIERVVDEVLDIPILWEPIPLHGPLQIVSKLTQPTIDSPARITLNESLLQSTFRSFPGLDRTALAHEAGHAVFHLQTGLSQQLTLGFDLPATFVSQAEAFTDRLDDVLKHVGPQGDDWWREWQAHTFMRFILMPRSLLLPTLDEVDLRTWRGMYDLRDRFGVTISALVVHLTRLKIVDVDAQKRIHDASPSARGQTPLDL